MPKYPEYARCDFVNAPVKYPSGELWREKENRENISPEVNIGMTIFFPILRINNIDNSPHTATVISIRVDRESPPRIPSKTKVQASLFSLLVYIKSPNNIINGIRTDTIIEGGVAFARYGERLISPKEVSHQGFSGSSMYVIRQIPAVIVDKKKIIIK